MTAGTEQGGVCAYSYKIANGGMSLPRSSRQSAERAGIDDASVAYDARLPGCEAAVRVFEKVGV